MELKLCPFCGRGCFGRALRIYAQHIEDYGYERRWLAYRRKPKETQT